MEKFKPEKSLFASSFRSAFIRYPEVKWITGLELPTCLNNNEKTRRQAVLNRVRKELNSDALSNLVLSSTQ